MHQCTTYTQLNYVNQIVSHSMLLIIIMKGESSSSALKMLLSRSFGCEIELN